ncbi:MAG: hypothetical protein ACRD2E_02365 [Terriglobales bacterium]
MVVVPAGVRLDLALPRAIPIHRPGQLFRARLADPIFAANRLALPAGTLVRGKITAIHGVAWWRRVQAAIGGDFSPQPAVAVTFIALRLPGGPQVPIRTTITPAGPPLRLVASPNGAPRKPSLWHRARAFLGTQIHGFRSFLGQQRHWRVVKEEAIQSLPYHPNNLPAGTSYEARLQTPLGVADAGPAPLPLASGSPHLPTGLIIHARLRKGLSSATAKWGAPVVAVVDRPVVGSAGRLLIPQGSRLTGYVTQVRPARRLDRNGQLRFTFSRLQFPAGAARAVQARLQAAASGQRLAMNQEGGVRATAPSAAPALALAVLLNQTVQGDEDNAWTLNAGSGTHLAVWGTAMAALLSSARPLAMGLGYVGSAQTVYRRFLARGHDVVFPAGTRLRILLEAPPPHRPRLPLSPAPAASRR